MVPARRTRIMIVDDSAVMRSLLRSVVTAEAGLEVAGTAADGATALNSLETLRPDLLLLDVEMPVQDGLVTLRKLRERGFGMPVIMCSALTQRGARVTIEALAAGASDYVAKPVGQPSRETAMQALSQDLIPRIRALTSQPPLPDALRLPMLSPLSTPLPASQILPSMLRAQPISAVPEVLVIGVSTGGPAALDVLLPALPAVFPLPVLVVQHMPEAFTGLFAERLDRRCSLRVRQAAEGDAVQTGTIYIARGNWHMEVLAAACAALPPTLHLSQGLAENHCRPAVDVLFRSAAGVYGAGVLAVVLTGMGSDGLIGCRMVRGQGGSVLAQDQASSVVWGMPGAVVQAGLANKVLPLHAIAPEVILISNRIQCAVRTIREPVS
jgi:two-component system chemotaxis response regulator CheB